MSYKTRFYKMTKPTRFRYIKLLREMFRVRLGKEKRKEPKEKRKYIKYIFNNILYKLKIVKRFNYRDNVEKVLPVNFPRRSIHTKYFRGLVSMRLVEVTNIYSDYFYREKKDGSRKIIMYVKNVETKSVYAESHLINICINIGGKWFNTNNSLPTFVVHNTERLKPFIPQDKTERTSPQTITYDVDVLKGITHKSFLGLNITVDDISKSMQKYYYDIACENLYDTLNEMSLASIMK